MASARGLSSLKSHEWMLDGERRDRSRIERSPRDRHPRSPRHTTSSEWEVQRDFLESTSSERYQGSKGPRRRSYGFHESGSPHWRSRDDGGISHRSRDTADERATVRHRNRHESPPAQKRRRSRSASPRRSYRKKTRHGSSKSPYGSDISQGGHRRERSHSPRRSPPPSSRSRKWTAHGRRSPENLPPPPGRWRSRSPVSRQGSHLVMTRGRSPPPERRILVSSKRDFSPHHSPPPSRYSSNRRPYSPPSRSLETRGRQKMDSRIMESSRRSPRIIDRYAPPSPRHRAYMGARSQQHSPHRRPRAANSSKTSSPTSRPLSAQDSQSNVLHKMVPPSSPDKSQSIEVSNGYPPSKTKGLSRELDAKERKMENPPASPPRPIPSFADSPNSPDPVRLEDSVHLRDAFPLHGMNANNIHRGPPRPHIETQQPFSNSPPFLNPNSAHHISPQGQSSYPNGRPWPNQPPQSQPPPPYFRSQHNSPVHQYPASQPSYRQANYSPQNGPPPQSQYYSALPQHGQYTASQGSMPTGFQGQPSHPNHQVFHPQYSPDQERRFSGPPAPTPSPKFPSQTRGSIGQFNNQHWNANNRVPSRTRYEQHSSSARQLVPSIEKSPSPPTQIAPTEDVEAEQRVNLPPVPSSPAVIETKAEPQIYADIGSSAQVTSQAPTKAPAKEVVKNVEENPVKITIASNKISMPPPSRPSPASRTPQPAAQEKGGSKFSFAFKAKAAPSPKPDLLTKLREPVLRPSTILRGEVSKKSHSRTTSRESHSQSSREAPAVEMKILKRIKPRPTIDPQFVSSDSVYFRKPGNESVIGSGTYGKVFKGIHVYTKDLVALKKIRMEGERDGFPVTAIREIKLLQSIKHENVVSLREVMVEKNDCFMVFEYLSHDLTGLLNHPSFKLESSHKKHLAKQMFDGLNYLHRQGVLHRDIKAANILISSEGKLKLADFGLARFFVKRRQLDYTNRVITIWYRSPELLLGETQYGPAVDIWSAACVLIEIFTKHAIFPGDGGEINQLDKIYNILGTPTRSEWPGLVDMAWFELLRPTERKKNVFADKYKERLTPAAFDLLSAMFLYDPAKRPSASDVLEHPYFTVEDPAPKQAIELRDLSGDWHEYESKALRKEKERKEARKASTKEKEKEKEKRRASVAMSAERDAKRQQIVATTYLGKAA